MRSLLLIFLVISNDACTETNVYVCNSKTVTGYHYEENCRGLCNCNYSIITITLDSARKSNKTLYKWEQ